GPYARRRRRRHRHARHRLRGDRPMSDTAAGAPAAVLSAHVREEIDRWVAKFPPGRQRSAIIGALHAAQHENHGYLTPEIMTAVADYLQLPAIQVFEVA